MYPKILSCKIEELRNHINKALNVQIKNDDLIFTLVQMSEIVEDPRLKHVFLKPFKPSPFEKGDPHLLKQFDLIRMQVQKVISLSQNLQNGFNKNQLQELHQQIENAIFIVKALENKIKVQLSWIIAPNVTNQLQKIKIFLEKKDMTLKDSSGFFHR